MAVANRIAKIAGASAIQKVVLVGQHFILVPLFISYWGPANYGEWLTLSAIPAALALSDLGLCTSFANEFVIRHAGGRLQSAADLFKTGLWLILAIAILVAAMGAIALGLALRQDWFASMHVGPMVAVQVVAVLGITRIIAIIVGLHEACFRASRRVHTYVLISAVSAVLSLVGGIVALTCGGGLVAFALAQSAITVLFGVFLCWKGRRYLDGMPPGRLIRESSVIMPLLRKGAAYMLTPFQQALSIQGTTLVIRAVLGPEAVAVFGTIRTLSNSAVQALGIATASLIPELQLAMAEQRQKLVQRLYATGLLVCSAIGMICATGIGAFGATVYSYWTQGKLDPPASLWFAFMAMLAVRSVWWAACMVFSAANQPERFTVVSFAAALAGILVSWALAHPLGLLGVALGCAVMEIIILAWGLPNSASLVGIPLRQLGSHLKDTALEILSKSCHHLRQRFQFSK